MSGCTDKKFEKMLYAYELGLLSDEEREAVEMHHLECDYCFEKAKNFQETARLLRSNKEIKESVGRMAEEQPGETGDSSDDNAKIVRRSVWKKFIPVTAAAAVILFLFVFRFWTLEFDSGGEVIAVENRLAVMYFENLSDENDSKRLGEITTNLTITGLAESDYVQVVSSQRLYDILRYLGRENAKKLGRDVALEVAIEAKARWMLIGGIIQQDSGITITSQLIEVASGNYIASQKVIGGADEDIFSVVDRLTAEIIKDLALPAEAMLGHSRSVAEVTTSSPEAYLYFVEGIDYYYKYYCYEATEKFKKAVELDSTFAMAYCYLARTDNPEYIEKAVQYNKNASQLDRYFIFIYNAFLAGQRHAGFKLLHELIERYPDEKYAYYLLAREEWYSDRLDSAIYYFNAALEIDPMFKNAYADLARVYNQFVDLENALRVINKYIELAPDEAYPFEVRAEIYASNGMLTKAINSYKKAVEIKPDFYSAWQKLGYMYIFDGNYDSAEKCFRQNISSPDKNYSITARYCLALIPIYQGKFGDAVKILDQSLELNRHDPVRGVEGEIRAIKALVYDFMDQPAKALEEIRTGIASLHADFPNRKLAYLETEVRLLARNGKFDEARELAENIKQDLSQDDFGMHQYYYGMAAIAYYKNNWETTIEYINKIFNLDGQCQCTHVHYLLGMAYMKSGRVADAVGVFENQLQVYSIRGLIWGGWYVEMHYRLGLAYEQSNWNEKAAEQYRILLDIWNEADYRTDIIADARKRLKNLESTP